METSVKEVELRELWRRCKIDDDQRARERLVVAYSPLVKYVAGRMASGLPSHVEEADLISYGVRARAREIEKVHAKLEHDLQRTPTEEEMAGKLDMSLDEFRDALLEIANSSVLALDDLWTVADPGGGQISLLDTIRDPTAVDPQQEIDANELKDRLAIAIESVPDRERLVIALYYYENLTLREIGEVLGVTESRVSQLHTKAVIGLRANLQTVS
jgi:RNA polymerase sigma factor for flagellar operon FliA